jgi:hypothetical protein
MPELIPKTFHALFFTDVVIGAWMADFRKILLLRFAYGWRYLQGHQCC